MIPYPQVKLETRKCMTQYVFYHLWLFYTGDHFHSSASDLADNYVNVEHLLTFMPGH